MPTHPDASAPTTVPTTIRAMRAWTLAVVVLALLCAANVAWFTWLAAIPLPASDAWYFLSVFVSKSLEDGVGLSDLFVQRGGGSDHAQPLQKLVLLWHLYAADLDFRLEAMVGVLAAVATCGLLARDLLLAAPAPAERVRAALGAMAVLLVGLSLNSTGIYTWSLVSLGWLMVLVAVLYWRVLVSAPQAPITAFLLGAGMTLVMALLLDELAIPVVIALLLARSLGDPRGARRSPSLTLAAGAIAGLLAARLVIQHLSPTPDAVGPSLSVALAALEGWQAFLLLVGGPLANALVHVSHVQPGSGWAAWVGIGLVSALAHLAFWWRVLVSRRLPEQRIRVMAIAMMLMFYATVAGILLSRVPDFGVEYVHQPRYVLFYQVGVLAWILLFAAPIVAPAGAAPRPARAPGFGRYAVFAAVLLLAVLQGWLSMRAWAFLPYQRAYVVQAAKSLASLAETKLVPPEGCPDILTVCASSPNTRARLLALLQGHQLNLFSEEFRARHGLALGQVADVPGTPVVAGAACANAVRDWGPTQIQAGEAFNVQGDGQSAYWISLEPGTAVSEISLDGEPIAFATGDNLVSFLHGPTLQAQVARGRDIALRVACADGTETRVTIQVRPASGPEPAGR